MINVKNNSRRSSALQDNSILLDLYNHKRFVLFIYLGKIVKKLKELRFEII